MWLKLSLCLYEVVCKDYIFRLVSKKMGKDSKYDNKEIWNVLDKKSKFALSRWEVRFVMNIQCKLSLNFEHIQDVACS